MEEERMRHEIGRLKRENRLDGIIIACQIVVLLFVIGIVLFIKLH